VARIIGETSKNESLLPQSQSSNRGQRRAVEPSTSVPLPGRLVSDVPTNYLHGVLVTGEDTLLSEQFGEDAPRLQVAVNRYRESSLVLERMLRNFFEDYHIDTQEKLWTPLPALQTGQDIPLLDMAMKDVGNAIATLTVKFGVNRPFAQLKKAKRGLTEYMSWMITPLKNFLVIAKEGQAVCSIGGLD